MPGLVDVLKRRIAENGPITVADYMTAALTDPGHGYYMRRDPFGRAGDFITAPEVSQMFGELIGLTCAEAWQAMGRPESFQLVELGPGRGTLMADALRAGKVVQGFNQAARVSLIEISSALRAKQKDALAGLAQHPPQWLDDFSKTPEGPLVVVANEFFDALPVRQFVNTRDGWRERLVTVGKTGEFAFGLSARPLTRNEAPRAPINAPLGSVFEVCPAAVTLVAAIAGRLSRHRGQALIVDYGHDATALGDTLQAVKNHRYAEALAEPGDADLTAHVDFQVLKRAAGAAGAQVFGPVDQGRWLMALGIRVRADSLKKASPGRVQEIDAALKRLIGGDAMGRLFKALALASPGMPKPPGFA
ncbi:MAG: class I SAM-dependent methyltransferase [Rhodospirillales bacterium]